MRALELKQQGWRQRDIASALGASEVSVSRWLARAREGGRDALLARPAPGRPPKLSPQGGKGDASVFFLTGAGASPYAASLPSHARAAPGGLVAPTLHHATARRTRFRKPRDYDAFLRLLGGRKRDLQDLLEVCRRLAALARVARQEDVCSGLQGVRSARGRASSIILRTVSSSTNSSPVVASTWVPCRPGRADGRDAHRRVYGPTQTHPLPMWEAKRLPASCIQLPQPRRHFVLTP